ncbi:MAG: lipopolysaccharide transport periplasmic protein LptA [Pseudomonadota bacterium]
MTRWLCNPTSEANMRRSSVLTTLTILVVLSCAASVAQIQTANLPILLDAENSSLDLANNRSVFQGLRITQGSTRIEARQAETAARSDFTDSEWAFSGEVSVKVGSARINADTATLYFSQRELKQARVSGNPARFEDRDPVTGAITRGQAQTFVYDLATGIVRFENNARVADERNEVAGKLLVYNVAEKKVEFEGDAAAGERVQIVIQPPEQDTEQRLRDASSDALESSGVTPPNDDDTPPER